MLNHPGCLQARAGGSQWDLTTERRRNEGAGRLRSEDGGGVQGQDADAEGASWTPVVHLLSQLFQSQRAELAGTGLQEKKKMQMEFASQLKAAKESAMGQSIDEQQMKEAMELKYKAEQAHIKEQMETEYTQQVASEPGGAPAD